MGVSNMYGMNSEVKKKILNEYLIQMMAIAFSKVEAQNQRVSRIHANKSTLPKMLRRLLAKSTAVGHVYYSNSNHYLWGASCDILNSLADGLLLFEGELGYNYKFDLNQWPMDIKMEFRFKKKKNAPAK